MGLGLPWTAMVVWLAPAIGVNSIISLGTSGAEHRHVADLPRGRAGRGRR